MNLALLVGVVSKKRSLSSTYFILAGQSIHSRKFKHLKYSENVNFEGNSISTSITWKIMGAEVPTAPKLTRTLYKIPCLAQGSRLRLPLCRNRCRKHAPLFSSWVVLVLNRIRVLITIFNFISSWPS